MEFQCKAGTRKKDMTMPVEQRKAIHDEKSIKVKDILSQIYLQFSCRRLAGSGLERRPGRFAGGPAGPTRGIPKEKEERHSHIPLLMENH